jgi:hypothetical protein
MLGRCIKPTALAAGLSLISFAAVSLSGQAGYSFVPLNAAQALNVASDSSE